MLPVLLTPLYIPAAAYVHFAHPQYWRFQTLCGLSEKLFASLIAAVSVVLLLTVLRRLTSERNAILLTIAYAFATETWAISSQALWQHGFSELLLVLGLMLLTSDASPRKAIGMGIVCSLLAFNRPPDVFFSLALAVSYLWTRRSEWVRLLVGAIAASAPFLIYNLVVFRHPAGGYGGLVHGALLQTSFWRRAGSALGGFAALLASPGKGLLVYSPFFLFLAASPMLRFPDRGRLPTALLWIAFAMLVLVHSFTDWRAGYSYGPRFLTDALPFLIVVLVPGVERLSNWWRKASFLALIVWAIGVQMIGAFCFPGGNSMLLSQEDFWKPSGAQFYRDGKAGFQREDYFYRLLHWLGISRSV